MDFFGFVHEEGERIFERASEVCSIGAGWWQRQGERR